ncbi:MAG: polysaccharide biosynthesis protein, partial [Candidatus Zixiibacteriota bacterium]
MNTIKKLAGQTAVYGLSSVIGRFLNYLLVPLYTYNLPTGQYGIVTELYAYVSFLIIILTYGMETGFFRFSETETNLNKVYSTTLTSLFSTSSLFIFFFLAFYKNIASTIGYTSHPEYILWFAFIIATDAFVSIPFAKLRRENKAIKFAIIKLINIFVNVGLNLFFIKLCPYLIEQNPDSWVATFGLGDISIKYIFISNLAASLITLLLLLPDILNVKFEFDKVLLKKILIYSLPLLVAGLAGMVNETLDRILLKVLLPATSDVMQQIGIYGANYKIAILMTLFIQMFRYAAEPFFFSQAKEKDAKETYAKVMKYFIIFGLLIFLFVMLYIDVIKYFIGTDYREGLKIVPIILLANLFLGIIYNLSVWYKLTNKTKFGAYIALIGAGITIILNIILIPRIGYMGSAWATFFCYFSMMIISFIWSRRTYKISYDIKNLLLYFFLALAIFFFVTYFTINNPSIKYTINSILLLGFILLAVLKE